MSRPESAAASRGLVRWGGPLAMLGGALWLLLWVHFLLTHGPTTSDYRNTSLGLSYYDSTKLAVFALTLCMAGLVSLRVRPAQGDGTPVVTVGYYLAIAGLVATIAGVAVSYWAIPWDETGPAVTTLMRYGVIAVMVASLIAFLGLTLLGIGAARTKVLPSWAVAPLAIAGLAAVPWLHHTLFGVLIGPGWLVVGFAIWQAGPRPESVSTP